MRTARKIVLCCLVTFSFFIKSGQERETHEQTFCRRICATVTCTYLALTATQVAVTEFMQPPNRIQQPTPHNYSMVNHSMANYSMANYSSVNSSAFNSSIEKFKKD